MYKFHITLQRSISIGWKMCVLIVAKSNSGSYKSGGKNYARKAKALDAVLESIFVVAADKVPLFRTLL